MNKKLEEKLKDFEHKHNPQHFYCRLKEFNIPTNEAKRMMKVYEIEVYKNVIELIKKNIK